MSSEQEEFNTTVAYFFIYVYGIWQTLDVMKSDMQKWFKVTIMDTNTLILVH